MLLLNDTVESLLPPKYTLSHATLNILNNVQDEREVSSYVQSAGRASLQPSASGGYQLTLNDVNDEILWVDDAPGTYSDRRPLSQFVLQWPHLFKDAAPNAALVGSTSTGAYQVYFLTLDEASYDAATQTMSFGANFLDGFNGAPEALFQPVLLIDSGNAYRFPMPGKGTAYQAFGHGYDPSTANDTYIYFGSDIASKQSGSLWGTQSYLSVSCAPDCRNDLQTIKDMNINLLRVYDWEPRNDHSQFLNYAFELGMKVVVPISNWLPQQTPNVWADQLPAYFRYGNFGNAQGNDWHPAIAGVIISNELDRLFGGQFYSGAVGLAAAFIEETDRRGFSKNVPVGVPVTFAKVAEMPAWHAFDRLIGDPRMAAHRDRLMLAPQTYNDAFYLYENAEGTGKGWVDLTWERYKLPTLFTEIGRSRTTSHAETPGVIVDQLKRSLEYQIQHPDRLLGVVHFQFDNKIWKQTPYDTDSEGAFGAFRHGDIVRQIPVSPRDYSYSNSQPQSYGTLTIDRLEPTITYGAVVEAYR